MSLLRRMGWRPGRCLQGLGLSCSHRLFHLGISHCRLPTSPARIIPARAVATSVQASVRQQRQRQRGAAAHERYQAIRGNKCGIVTAVNASLVGCCLCPVSSLPAAVHKAMPALAYAQPGSSPGIGPESLWQPGTAPLCPPPAGKQHPTPSLTLPMPFKQSPGWPPHEGMHRFEGDARSPAANLPNTHRLGLR